MTRKLLPLICVLALARIAAAQAELRPEDVLGQDREITLQQAVGLALEHNLSLQIVRNDPAVAREQVRQAEGLFDPLLLSGFNQDHVETPVASSLQSFFGTTGNRTVDDSKRYATGLTGVLPWGFSYSSGYTFRQLNSSSGITSLKPQYTADWTSSITIPLLRNLYWSGPDLLVRQSSINQHVSDAQFTSQLSNLVFAVERAYWQLSASRALERATSEAVNTAKDTLQQTKVQYQVGTVSKVIVTQAEANLAQRESEYIVAVNAAKTAQDNLLTAIVAPEIGDYSTTTMRTEEPTFVPYEVDPQESVAKARANRSELVASELEVEQSDIQEKYAWNQKLPSFNVGASYSMDGLSGTQKTAPGAIIVNGVPRPGLSLDPARSTLNDNGTPMNPADDYYTAAAFPVAVQSDFGFGTSPGSAHNDFFAGEGFHSWGFNAVFSIPLGNETADARYIQSKIELRRARTNLKRTEQSVVLEVRTAVRELLSSIDLVKAAQRARVASEETLHAEQEKLRLGDSTPHDVQLFQEGLLRAEGAEIEALRVYRTAISGLEYAQGTLLDARGISVEKERERGMDEY
jgi:outer membrane protein